MAGAPTGAGAAALSTAGKARRLGREPADIVVASAAGLLVIIFAIFGFLVWQGYSSTLSQAESRARNGADVVANQAQWIVGSAVAMLGQFADADPLASPGQADAAWARLVKAAGALPERTAVALYGPDGTPMPGRAGEATPASIAGSDLLRDLSGKEWVVAPSDGTGTITVGRRLESGGAFAGAVLLSVDGEVLESLWSRLNLGRESTVSIVRDDGWLIARYPTLGKPLNLAGTPSYERLQGGDVGTYASEASPADGQARFVGFHRVPALGVIAIASVSRDVMLDGLWYATRTVLYLMAPIAIALLLGSLLTARLLRQSARTQRTLAAAVANNEVLFREIHHRVKNNLQSVVSLLQLQPIPRDVKTEMAQRISAMSAVHEHIYRSNSFSTVHVRDYLRTLIDNIRAGQAANVRVIEEIDDLTVDKDAAAPLGLILNEVVSNAFKHAFADGREGVVTVRLVRDAPAVGRLMVEDNGVGFDPTQPAKGIGRRLIAALTEQLGGSSSFSSAASGARFVLTFPLAEGHGAAS